MDSNSTDAKSRRFRFSLSSLLIAICALSVTLAFMGKYLIQFQEQQAANRAVSYIQSRNGKISIGSPNDATKEERMDYTDMRNAVSVSFTGTILTEADFVQLAKVPNLVSITINNASIDEDNFLLLQRLPNLQFLVLENTGADETALKKIDEISSNWRVFKSWDELKQWSIARFSKTQSKSGQ